MIFSRAISLAASTQRNVPHLTTDLGVLIAEAESDFARDPGSLQVPFAADCPVLCLFGSGPKYVV